MKLMIDGKEIPIPKGKTIVLTNEDIPHTVDGELLTNKKYSTGGVIDKSKFPNGLFNGQSDNQLFIEREDSPEMVGKFEPSRGMFPDTEKLPIELEKALRKSMPLSEFTNFTVNGLANMAKSESEFKTKSENDAINPNHYKQGGIECIDALKSATIGKKGIEAVCVANIIKYLWRYEEKNGLEDVKKSRWYLDRLIAEIEGVNNVNP